MKPRSVPGERGFGKTAAGMLLGLLAALAAMHCDTRPTEAAEGGGGSEAVALVGSFEYPDHRPAAGARVRLRPRLFLPDTAADSGAVSGDPLGSAIDVRTDAGGGFRMDSVKRGKYFLEINDGGDRGLLIPCTLTGDSEVVRLEKAALRPTGAVTGSIVPPEGFAGRTYVQVYGMERQVKADSATGRFKMEGMPEGTYTLRAVYSSPAVDPREIANVSVAAEAQDTTDIGAVRLSSFENENYSAWPRARRIYLNTTAAGADVAGNVDDFPVLVRLTGANFDFSQSKGTDIRFADAKGKRLRYEVERWAPDSGAAELWVRLDRVNGNSNSQFITMHWGLDGAGTVADPRQVFGVDAGFAGVWHLGEQAPDTSASDLYEDAVGYDHAADRTASTDRSGVIGFGTGFGGTDYLTVPVANPLLQPNAAVTASAWVRATRTGPLGAGILSMGDSYNLRINPSGNGRFSLFNGDAEIPAVESPRGASLLDGTWHHLAGSYDGEALCIYVDGKLAARKDLAKSLIEYRFWPAFVMGRHGNRKSGYDFTGNIDQVEVSGELARSADWIKLAYENQRADAKLTEFRP